jgi:hypothetical protein
MYLSVFSLCLHKNEKESHFWHLENGIFHMSDGISVSSWIKRTPWLSWSSEQLLDSQGERNACVTGTLPVPIIHWIPSVTMDVYKMCNSCLYPQECVSVDRRLWFLRLKWFLPTYATQIPCKSTHIHPRQPASSQLFYSAVLHIHESARGLQIFSPNTVSNHSLCPRLHEFDSFTPGGTHPPALCQLAGNSRGKCSLWLSAQGFLLPPLPLPCSLYSWHMPTSLLDSREPTTIQGSKSQNSNCPSPPSKMIPFISNLACLVRALMSTGGILT